MPVALERSRSGNGGHIWLVFDEAIPAGLARRLGSHILTETMESRPDIGLPVVAAIMSAAHQHAQWPHVYVHYPLYAQDCRQISLPR
jgi:hypothetical protein